MNRVTVRLLRVMSRAYPAEFRRDFADDMVQVAIDRHRHEHISAWRILLDEAYDVVRAAPPQRWESVMSRIIIISMVAAATVAAAVAAQPMLAPLALLVVAGWIAISQRRRPIAGGAPRRWIGCLAGGVAGVVAAVAIPLIDGGELNAVWWSVMALTGIVGVTMLVAAVALAASGRGHHPHTATLG